jgi:hypothetical protein
MLLGIFSILVPCQPAYPYLLAPGLRDLFEAFRKEVLALDPCVTEEFRGLQGRDKLRRCGAASKEAAPDIEHRFPRSTIQRGFATM